VTGSDRQDDPIASGPDAMGAELAAWGRVLLLETRGRRSGARRVTAVGFVEEPDGSILIAAGSTETAWALNLLADPQCRVTIAGAERSCRARPVPPADAQRAVVALILRYGTPAERLGRGPVFRLVPVPAAPVPAGGVVAQ
jgi:deazaflavin-dependent oxidoreductase (nitroreductase family)